MERWEKEKVKEIKEKTIRGLEPEVSPADILSAEGEGNLHA